MTKKNLFPPFLNADSDGAAVDALHILLCALGYGGEIKRDRNYGKMTVAAVKRLQHHLGINEDGNFGPETRAALKAKMGIDVELIPGSKDHFADATNFVGPETPEGETEQWLPEYDE
jgi:peptidoglycan hydrolase-like protein with peptidoglycan-binding domain